MCFPVLRTVWNESTDEKEAHERTACSGKKDRKDSRGGKREFVQHAPTSAQGGHNLHHKKGILKGGWYFWEVVPFQTLPDATYNEGLQSECPFRDG